MPARCTHLEGFPFPPSRPIFDPVKIISRYVLKEHLGPLLFAFTALTSLLLLSYIARQLGRSVQRQVVNRVAGKLVRGILGSLFRGR